MLRINSRSYNPTNYCVNSNKIVQNQLAFGEKKTIPLEKISKIADDAKLIDGPRSRFMTMVNWINRRGPEHFKENNPEKFKDPQYAGALEKLFKLLD